MPISPGTAGLVGSRREVGDSLGFPWLGHPANHGKVRFDHTPLAELLTQPPRCFGGPREQHHSGYGSIQSMDKTEIDISRLSILFLQINFRLLQQCDISGSIPLDQ